MSSYAKIKNKYIKDLMMMKKSALKVVSSNKTPYDKTRHNAMRHGVLSHVAVLPWEKQEDLEHLKQRFFDDFNPQGAIEIYLVEELATLAFRKQRLYKAEDALIAKKLDQLESCFGKNPLYTSANLMSPSANVEGSYLHSIPMKSILYPDQKNDEESIVECRTKISQYQALLNKNDLTYETLLNGNGEPNKFDRKGKICLFGRAKMFQDAQDPKVVMTFDPK